MRRRAVFSGGSGRAQVGLAFTGNDWADTPDSAVLSVTGDLDLRVRVALTDWTPAANSTVISKWGGTTQRSYMLIVVGSTGELRFTLSAAGTGGTSVTSSAAVGFTDGTAHWVRATWRQSDGRVQFFTSEDGFAWTQLGVNRTIAIASIFDGTAVLSVGAEGAGADNFLAGTIYRAQVFADLNGAVRVFDANFTNLPNGTTTFNEQANGAVVTLHVS